MKQFLTKLMITHTGFQKADKLNFKTTGLSWQQSKQDQEIARNAQSKGILNPTNLKNRLYQSSIYSDIDFYELSNNLRANELKLICV